MLLSVKSDLICWYKKICFFFYFVLESDKNPKLTFLVQHNDHIHLVKLAQRSSLQKLLKNIFLAIKFLSLAQCVFQEAEVIF